MRVTDASPSTIQLIVTGIGSMLGGGFIGTVLTHYRLAPKASAEAREITAAAVDKDWARFQREIARLVDRLEKAELAADKASEGQIACELREIESQRKFAATEAQLSGRIAQLEGLMAGQGQARQVAAGIVALERSHGDDR